MYFLIDLVVYFKKDKYFYGNEIDGGFIDKLS